MIDDPAALTKALTAQVKLFEADLHERLDGPLVEVRTRWVAEHREALKRERTAQSWTNFSSDRITQAAVAWVLTTVFVRFCEDNALFEPVWFSGAGARVEEAANRQDAFIRKQAATHPDVTVRDWILDAIRYLDNTPATAPLVDSYSPIHLIEPSADACRELIGFWRSTDNSGQKEWDFADIKLSTRFLGDLYQDLSDSAKKKYALLQTPGFVEEFILDRTLTPALRETKASEIRLIDPTCGSGHFLLGAFARILDELYVEHPSMTTTGRVQLALDTVHGVDLNPFAVAITRFRLMVAAMKEAGNEDLDRDASDFTIMVAVGDSLLHGEIHGPVALARAESSLEVTSEHYEFVYADENQELLDEILRIGYYDVIVGNPPYITVKDKALNKRYRDIYDTCHMKYGLTVPFMERFFQLAKRGERAGRVGQITSNAFMKRGYGSKLIEEFFTSHVDLSEVIDTSGAYIPGHGTPTVIVVGRNREPGHTPVRGVLGIHGEPGKPGDPSIGFVWSDIVDHIDEPGYEGKWISVVDLDRSNLAKHPWSLTGGGAVELNSLLEAGGELQLDAAVESIGFAAITGEDDAFVGDPRISSAARRSDFPTRPFVEGTSVRDFTLNSNLEAIYPYFEDYDTAKCQAEAVLWDLRTNLRAGLAFGKTRRDQDKDYWEYILPNAVRLHANKLIAFAFVATHNHFVLDGGGKVFKQTAPVIKLPDDATMEQHLELLGVLNSSVACFWLRNNCFNKDPSKEPWQQRHEFSSTIVKEFPLPARRHTKIPIELYELAKQLQLFSPGAALDADGYSTRRKALDAYAEQSSSIRGRMIALQEELDWHIYQCYGLTDTEYVYAQDVPEVALGERGFEIVMARQLAAGEGSPEWFTRHGSTPITELPDHWPDEYAALVEQRISLIETNTNLGLLERPEYKRRWSGDTWEARELDALRARLCDELENRHYWFEGDTPITRSVANLADLVARDARSMEVLELYAGSHEPDVTKVLTKLLVTEAVPHLAAYRYKATGLRKRAEWEHTWDLQRQEDEGVYSPAPDGDDAPIPVPPKYATADFTKKEYWANRGKLDVTKERFILYPAVSRGLDATLRLGWAGWDHAQQALALANLIEEAKADGQSDEAIIPLAAGLEELEPWLTQRHGEYHPEYGEAPALLFTAILDELCIELTQTRTQLHDWRPASSGPRRTAKKASS